MAQGEPVSGNGQGFCSNCGRDMPANVQFCPYCGQRSEPRSGICARCGARIRPGDTFCTSCGVSLDPVRVGAPRSAAVGLPAVEYMGFWVRFAAWIVDFILLFVVQFVVSLTGLAFVSISISLFYGVLFIGLRGQTPGKRVLGIQVVNQQGQVPGIGRAALREIIGKLVSTVVILVGFFWIGWDRNKHGWHDHIAGTYVVRKQRNRP